MSTTEEFQAFCAELAAKLADGRALEEARARLRISRLKRLQEPEEYVHEWHDGGMAEDWA